MRYLEHEIAWGEKSLDAPAVRSDGADLEGRRHRRKPVLDVAEDPRQVIKALELVIEAGPERRTPGQHSPSNSPWTSR